MSKKGGGGGEERDHSFYAPPLLPATYFFALARSFVPFM